MRTEHFHFSCSNCSPSENESFLQVIAIYKVIDYFNDYVVEFEPDNRTLILVLDIYVFEWT